jgi:hypothetical protein
MSVKLQATDLLVVNRGGTNYQVTGAEVRAGALQPTDLLMVQRGGTLYKLAVADVLNLTKPLQSTDYIMVQRGDELYALNPQTLPELVPHVTINGNNTGVDPAKRAFSIKWTGAHELNGIKPQLRFESSTGLDTYFMGDHGDTWYVPNQLGSGDFKIQLFGAFTYFAFGVRESLGITSVVESTAGAMNLMVTQPEDNWGEDLFALAPKLTTVPVTMNLKTGTRLFKGCTVFNQDVSAMPNVNQWTSLQSTFDGCTAYNKTLATWTPANSTDFTNTFSDCTSFNQPLNAWGPSMIKATTTYGMFRNCEIFNRPLDTWTFGVSMTNMVDMFKGTTVFDQDLSGWCVTNIKSEPFDFAADSALQTSNYPVWGSCP